MTAQQRHLEEAILNAGLTIAEGLNQLQNSGIISDNVIKIEDVENRNAIRAARWIESNNLLIS